jgi:hypothetical protein
MLSLDPKWVVEKTLTADPARIIARTDNTEPRDA